MDIQPSEISAILKREIRNFEKTLRFLIEHDFGKEPSYLQLEDIDYLKTV